MQILNRFDTDKSFDYENGFYLTSKLDRMGKLIAHYELYKKIISIPGHILEFGVFKGNSLLRFGTFRNLCESPYSRKIIGFDIFGKFPETEFEPDKKYLQKFIDNAGENSISVPELTQVFSHKGIENFELVQGNILETAPKYKADHPHLKIALLHIDTDVYEPAVTILEHFYPMMTRGGIIVLDDYGTFPGETKAVDEFLQKHDLQINKLPIAHIPAYIQIN